MDYKLTEYDIANGIMQGELSGLKCPSGDHDYLTDIVEVVWNWTGKGYRVVVFPLTSGNYLLVTANGGGSTVCETKHIPSEGLLHYLTNYLAECEVDNLQAINERLELRDSNARDMERH